MGRSSRRAVAMCVVATIMLLAGGCAVKPWRIVSVSISGKNGANAPSQYPVVSPDGTKVAFFSEANDLGPTDTDTLQELTASDVYLRDLTTGTTTLVSSNAAGTDSTNGWTAPPWWSGQTVTFSPDGEAIVFATGGTDLGATDTFSCYYDLLVMSCQDLYLRDLDSGTFTLVSANVDGDNSGNGSSSHPAFSPDGTKIAFESYAGNLVADDTNGRSDVYVRDLASATTTLVSADSTGAGGGDKFSYRPVFSPDGTKIAFVSSSSNLGPTDTNGVDDVYLRDLVTGTTSLVTTNAAATNAGNGASSGPVFSPDGAQLAFASGASDLGPTDTNGQTDVYVRDLATGATSLVSADAGGTDSGTGASSEPRLSPDGQTVLFTSVAADLGPTDTNGVADLYLRDLATGATSLVSAIDGGGDSGDGPVVPGATFSPDGTMVVFASDAHDYGPTDTNGVRDVYLRDLVAGSTTLVSDDFDGDDSANGRSFDPQFGANDEIVFSTEGSNLGMTDSNHFLDVYLTRITGS